VRADLPTTRSSTILAYRPSHYRTGLSLLPGITITELTGRGSRLHAGPIGSDHLVLAPDLVR